MATKQCQLKNLATGNFSSVPLSRAEFNTHKAFFWFQYNRAFQKAHENQTNAQVVKFSTKVPKIRHMVSVKMWPRFLGMLLGPIFTPVS